jgi:putative ABC transport system ATP-binding protein
MNIFQEKLMSIVTLTDVKKNYMLGKVVVEAIKGVSLSIEEGDFIAIVGPSGSGKTTILNLIGCIDTATEGLIEIAGIDINTLDDKDLTKIRHEVIGFIFQAFNLIPVLNVYENIEFPCLLGSGKKLVHDSESDSVDTMSNKELKDWINYLIEGVGLKEWKNHKPNELSGGQRQRVAIARSLVTKPKIILADEPTANLDSKTGEDIIQLMKKINKEQNTTFIFSTHDPTIFSITDHIIQLKDGLIQSEKRN